MLSNSWLLADLVLLLHLAFILFVLAGAALVWRWPRLAWLHLPAVAWGAWIEISHGICPLTPLENHLRAQAGEAGYEGDFIGHYLLPLIYPDALTPGLQTLLGALALAVNAVFYAWLIRRRHQ
jgi:hypothetical protein